MYQVGFENQKLHYLNFEERKDLYKVFEGDLDPETIVKKISFTLSTTIANEDLIFFDEVQLCPRALTSLKYFAEKSPSRTVVAAGSLLGLTLSEGSFPVGNVDRLDLFPFTFSEFLGALGKRELVSENWELCKKESEVFEPLHQQLCNYLFQYYFTGGLPEVVSIATNGHFDFEHTVRIREKQHTLIKDYLADMAKHCGKINAMHLDRVFTSTATQLSAVHDQTTKRFQFRGVVPGISQYSRLAGCFDWLIQAGLIVKSYSIENPIHPLQAQQTESKFKSLIFDVGILNALANVAPEVILQQTAVTYKGYIAEQFVMQELRALGINSFTNWQSTNEAEIEFLIEHLGKVIPLEVKSGQNTRSKSLHSYKTKYAPHQSWILSGKPYIGLSGSNSTVSQLPLYFTEKLRSLL